MKKVIQNTTIITMDDEKESIMNGSIIVENGKIKKITEDMLTEKELNTADEVINGSGYVVIPGMTNAHYHSYSNLLKGTENNLPLEIWSLYTTAFGYSLEEEDIKNAVLLGAIDMLKSGVTSCIDHFPHITKSHSALEAYKQSGIRTGFAPMMHDHMDHHFLPVELPETIQTKLEQSTPPSPAEYSMFFKNLVDTWDNESEKINIFLGPNAPQRCTDEMLSLAKSLADNENTLVHTHLLETKVQRSVSDQKYKHGVVGKLNELNLLSNKLSVAHAIWLEDDEIDLLQANDVSVIHNPASNMVLGSGKSPISTYLQKGINVALGTDASNCGTSHNMFETMRLAVMLNRTNTVDYRQWITSADAFKMATKGGAKVAGVEDRRGQLREGYDADLVLVNKNTEALTPEEDIISQLVFYENGNSIDAVMIQGEWVLKNREIVKFDEQAVIDSVKARHSSLMKHSETSLLEAKELEKYYREMYGNINKLI